MLWILIGIVVLVAVGATATWLTLRSDHPTGDEATGIGIAFLAAGLGTIPTLGIGMIGLAAVGLVILVAGRRSEARD